MSLFVDHLRSQPLYTRLCETFDTREGNLLQWTREATAEAQVEALRWILKETSATVILETGTNTAMFGYVLSQLHRRGDPPFQLLTCDIDPAAQKSTTILAESQTSVLVAFLLGDTKETLVSVAPQRKPDLAWVDGGHDYETALNDIQHAMRMGAKIIAIDDLVIPSVSAAVADALAYQPVLETDESYERMTNPFVHADDRKLLFLRRVAR